MKCSRLFIAGAVTMLLGVLVIAWNPSSSSFNTNQFSAVAPDVSIKSGALLTNSVLRGTVTDPNSSTGTAGQVATSSGSSWGWSNATTSGTQVLANGLNGQSLSANTTNFYYVVGSAGGASAFNTEPVGIDSQAIELRAFSGLSIGSGTNITFELFTNSLNGVASALSTGFKVTLGAGVHSDLSTSSIPLKAGYGYVIGVWANGTALASHTFAWSLKLAW